MQSIKIMSRPPSRIRTLVSSIPQGLNHQNLPNTEGTAVIICWNLTVVFLKHKSIKKFLYHDNIVPSWVKVDLKNKHWIKVWSKTTIKHYRDTSHSWKLVVLVKKLHVTNYFLRGDRVLYNKDFLAWKKKMLIFLSVYFLLYKKKFYFKKSIFAQIF